MYRGGFVVVRLSLQLDVVRIMSGLLRYSLGSDTPVLYSAILILFIPSHHHRIFLNNSEPFILLK